MKKPVLCAAFALFFAGFTGMAHEVDSPEGRILKRDFETMMSWFPGIYDNQEQVYFEQEMGVAEELRHERINHIFAPVDLPDFPGRTFYIQQSMNGDPGNIYRQRIYSFEPDFEENAVRLTIYTPKDAKKLVDAHLNPRKLKGLKPDNMTTIPGCEVFWKADAEHFHGYMKPKACSFVSKRSGKKIIITDDLRLTENSIWIRDEAEDADGNYVFGNKAHIHHKNNKAQKFKCWVSVKKEDGEYTFDPDVILHDQGGMAWIDEKPGVHPKVGIKMRNVVWPHGNNRNSLVLYAYKGDDPDTAASYAWTSPDEPRIGINVRWLQASCTRDDTGFFASK